MANNEHAHESRWGQWVATEACTWLAGQRCPFVSPRAGRTALPETFLAWLLDRQRWGREGFGDAWAEEGSPRAAEFIRRSVESWPEEDMSAELKRLVETQNLASPNPASPDLASPSAIPANQAEQVGLLAWWLTLNRGLVPQDFTPGNLRRQVYGDIVTTRVGKAVYNGLLKQNRRFVHESGQIAAAPAEAYRTIFDTCLGQTLDYLYRTERKIVDLCRKYQPGLGDVWGFLHRCIENYIRDFLESKDKEVNVPTINMADQFRRILQAAERQVNPHADGPTGADDLSQEEQMEVMTWRGGRNPRAFEEEPTEDLPTTEPARTIPSGAAPVARALLLLKYTPPTDWSNVSIHELANDFGLAGPGEEQFVELALTRSRRLELALLRRDACFEKREHLRGMKVRTVEGLKKALVQEGHSREQVRQRIDLLERQAAAGEVLLGEVRAVQKDKNCPVDSQAYLAARFQELTLCEEKMTRYTANYEAEWEDRFTVTSQEWKTLAEIFATTPQNVKQQLTQLEQQLGLSESGQGR